MADEPKFWQDGGKWIATTLGMFASTLIDSGPNDTVFVRVIRMGENDESGAFTLQLEVHLVPPGHVLEHAKEIGCGEFHNRLIAQIEKGLVG